MLWPCMLDTCEALASEGVLRSTSSTFKRRALWPTRSATSAAFLDRSSSLQDASKVTADCLKMSPTIAASCAGVLVIEARRTWFSAMKFPFGKRKPSTAITGKQLIPHLAASATVRNTWGRQKAPLVQTTIKVSVDSVKSMLGANTEGALVADCTELLLSKWTNMCAVITASQLAWSGKTTLPAEPTPGASSAWARAALDVGPATNLVLSSCITTILSLAGSCNFGRSLKYCKAP
mmetsp:Transcript_119481/g.300338  ORF Transcript_119481/g.300338 Transcript_119481/m.300338 type:complete len:235 (+) Transcript_119481:543-1247(+)